MFVASGQLFVLSSDGCHLFCEDLVPVNHNSLILAVVLNAWVTVETSDAKEFATALNSSDHYHRS